MKVIIIRFIEKVNVKLCDDDDDDNNNEAIKRRNVQSRINKVC